MKRKASSQPSIGLDSGRASPRIELTPATANLSESVVAGRPTGEGKPLGVTTNKSKPVNVHVAEESGLGTSLFWALLGWAGYEIHMFTYMISRQLYKQVPILSLQRV